MNRAIPMAAALALWVAGSGGCDMARKESQKPEPAAAPPAAPSASSAPSSSSALLAPGKAVEQAPATYKARFSTTKGDFVVEVQRDWAPRGADRFYNLVKLGYFDGIAFFRAIDGFMVQFGINGDPAVNRVWREARIQDDVPTGQSNVPGAICFATSGPNSRTTQVFINYGNNGRLDSMGFTPFGKVAAGMDVVRSLYKGYGEGAPDGMGPEQGRIQQEGNAYLKAEFPSLDWVKTARIES